MVEERIRLAPPSPIFLVVCTPNSSSNLFSASLCLPGRFSRVSLSSGVVKWRAYVLLWDNGHHRTIAYKNDPGVLD